VDGMGTNRLETGYKKEEKTAADAFNKSKKKKEERNAAVVESQVRPKPEVLS